MNLDELGRVSPTPHAATEVPARRGTQDPGCLILLWVLTIPALFFVWHEVEPLLTFRPVLAMVVGSDVARLHVQGSRRAVPEFEPEVFYRYVVSGITYMGRKYQRTNVSMSLPAEEHAGEFLGGGTVQAWYNPRHPDEAVLTRAPNVELLAFVVLGLTALWAYAYTLRVPGSQPPAESNPIK